MRSDRSQLKRDKVRVVVERLLKTGGKVDSLAVIAKAQGCHRKVVEAVLEEMGVKPDEIAWGRRKGWR